MNESREVRLSYYHYDPSLAAAILFSVLYGLAFVLTVVQWVRFRPLVWLVIVLAAAMEAVGYVCRCISIKNLSNRNIYGAQFGFLILAPVLMAGVLYVLFGRIIFLVVPKDQRTFKVCWVPPRFVTPVFVTFDLLAFLLQMGGAVLITTVNGASQNEINRFNRGRNLALAGVILQIIAFGLFTVAAVRFNFTSKQFIKSTHEPLELQNETALRQEDQPMKNNWRALLRVLNFATLMILVRSIYRLVEFTEGRLGYINTHEWVLYVFDAVPILPCVALFIYWHPSLYLPYLGFRLPKHAR